MEFVKNKFIKIIDKLINNDLYNKYHDEIEVMIKDYEYIESSFMKHKLIINKYSTDIIIKNFFPYNYRKYYNNKEGNCFLLSKFFQYDFTKKHPNLYVIIASCEYNIHINHCIVIISTKNILKKELTGKELIVDPSLKIIQRLENYLTQSKIKNIYSTLDILDFKLNLQLKNKNSQILYETKNGIISLYNNNGNLLFIYQSYKNKKIKFVDISKYKPKNNKYQKLHSHFVSKLNESQNNIT